MSDVYYQWFSYQIDTVHCKLFTVENIPSFPGFIGDCKIFPVSCESFPTNYSLILHTAKVFHLELLQCMISDSE